jgi:hypothetical protein
MRYGLRYAAPFALLAATLTFAACSSGEKRSGFGEKQDTDGVDGEQGFVPGQVPCAGLECKRVACGGGVTTTLTGKVYDPAGANPLYNVQVYIPGGADPDGELPPFSDSTVDGIQCQTCNAVALNPLVSALTNAKGEFVLENVPVEKDVPLVVQIGKWRHKFHVDIQDKCEENSVPDKTLKLPKNGSEGDMPQIAVTSGMCDALECMLRGLGIDDSEFVSGHGGSGHVHVFKGSGGKLGADAESELWNDEAQLKKYDITLLSCECSENEGNKGGMTPGARASMYEYLNAGGRVFATHYQHVWFSGSPQDELKQLASWADGYGGDGEYDINMSFPKGEMMAEWLKETGASGTLGKIPLKAVRGSVQELRDPAVPWIVKNGSAGAKFFTVNTPISAPVEEQCGRAVFSDLHITDAAGPSSIGSCPISAGGLNGQQKALEFIFFDLSACVQDDKEIPMPPK